ncbi:MAG: protein kinase [Blastocatellia bacterium]|nr:protein kinase [Blastocatellia bacterium]
MKICPACSTQFDDTMLSCPRCQAALASAQTIPGTEQIPGVMQNTDQLIGQLVDGRFQILSKLGEGGMGAVFKAEHTKMNRLCAIKIMSASIAGDKDSYARFIREAQMSSKLDHPHAVMIYDFGETENGLVYLAMEYVEGEMLSTLLRREGALPIDRVLFLARQAGSALEAAHKLSIIHRDLKPDNIMIGKKDGRDWVKVLDFGIAKVATEDQRHDLTAAGMVIGTPLYMSPEQLAGEKLDARSDIYSFALIIYQMLTGVLPFQGENTQAIMVKRLTENPMPIRFANPNVRIPEDMEAALLQALARDRNHRPQNMTALLTMLESGAAQTGQVAPGGAVNPTLRPMAPGGTNPFPPAASYQTAGNAPVSTGQPSQRGPATPGQFAPPPTVAAPMANTPGQPMPPMPGGNFPPGQPPMQPGFQPQPQRPPMGGPGMPPMGGPGMAPAAGPGTKPMGGPGMPPPPMPNQPPAKKGGGLGIVIALVLVLIVLGGGGLVVLGIMATKSKTEPVVTENPPDTKPEKNTKTDKTEKPETDKPVANSSGPSAEAQAAYDDGVALMQKKQYRDAEKKFREAVAFDPNYADAHYNLGVALFNNYKLADSVEELKQAVRLSDNDDRKFKAYYARGLANWELKRYDQAEEDFAQASKHKSDNQEVLAYRGFVLQLAGRQSEANQVYDDFLAKNSIGTLTDMVKQCRDGSAVPPKTLKEGGFNPLE